MLKSLRWMINAWSLHWRSSLTSKSSCPLRLSYLSNPHWPGLSHCPVHAVHPSTKQTTVEYILCRQGARIIFVQNTTIGDKGQLASFPGSLKNGEGESQVTFAGNVLNYWCQALPALIRLQNETMHTSEILSTQQKLDNSKKSINTNCPSQVNGKKKKFSDMCRNGGCKSKESTNCRYFVRPACSLYLQLQSASQNSTEPQMLETEEQSCT